MTMKMTDSGIILYCDGKSCAEVLETGADAIDEAFNFSWHKNWRTHKRTQQGVKQWLDACPDCRSSELKDAL